MIRYTDNTVMPFGPHKDKLLKHVPARYLLALKTDHYSLAEYIVNNRSALENRAKNEKYAAV